MKPLEQMRIIKCTVYSQNSNAYPEARILMVDTYKDINTGEQMECFLYPGNYEGCYVEYVRNHLQSIGIKCDGWGDISDDDPDFYVTTKNFEILINSEKVKGDRDYYTIVLTSAQPVSKLSRIKTATISIKNINQNHIDHIFNKHKNGPDAYEELKDFYFAEAKKLVDVLFKVLPGGTVDAILCEMLEKKRCLLSIPLMAGNGDIDSSI